MKIQRSTGVNGKRRCICRNLGWYRRDSAPLGRLGVPPFVVLSEERIDMRRSTPASTCKHIPLAQVLGRK